MYTPLWLFPSCLPKFHVSEFIKQLKRLRLVKGCIWNYKLRVWRTHDGKWCNTEVIKYFSVFFRGLSFHYRYFKKAIRGCLLQLLLELWEMNVSLCRCQLSQVIQRRTLIKLQVSHHRCACHTRALLHSPPSLLHSFRRHVTVTTFVISGLFWAPV